MSVDASAVARVIGITTTFKDLRANGVLFLPQRVVILGQGASTVTYSTEKFQITSAAQAGAKYGYGSPIHLAARELLPANGDGVGTIPVTVYPLEDAYEAIPAWGSITPSGTQTKAASYRVRAAGILSPAFAIAEGATVAARVAAMIAAINAEPSMPIIAGELFGVVYFEAKWAGPSGNDIVVEVIGESLGTLFTIVQAHEGLLNPSITDALAQMGNVWETMVLNCLNIADEEILDELQEFGEGRWGTLVKKPLVVFTGNKATTVSAATAVSSTRRDDRVNAQLVAPGSVNLPFMIAARQLARIAVLANNNPPTDYAAQRATGLIPGTDGEQWDYTERDQAVKAGSSTVEVNDGVVEISDVVTFYRPEGEEPPAYRFVVDIVKLQQVIFNVNLRFASDEWAGAPLIPDGQATVNPLARQPKAAKALVNGIIDALADEAILSDPKAAKKKTTAVINSQNPKRLDVSATVQLSGNTGIISVDLFFGFFFGTQVAA